MTFASFCTGIGAPEMAWTSLGWKPLFFSEIEPFPSAVLTERFPGVPNLGDMTRITDDQIERFKPDVVVAGTPCQSFSVAGLRGGMADPRGNLALVFLRLVDQLRPRWVVWENVPGVLSSNDGRDFGSFLGALGQLGYGFAYRVLDAQYAGVPQRRRRVFVVGCLGNWRCAAAVLFERHSLSGNPPPSREAWARVAALTANGVGTCGADDNQAQAGHLIAGTLSANGKAAGSATQQDAENGLLIAHTLLGKSNNTDPNSTIIAFAQNQRDEIREMSVAGSLAAEPGMKQQTYIAQAYTIHGTDKTARVASETDIAGSIRTRPPGSVENSSTTVAMQGMAVRRLTPLECERLQGFPDGHTDIAFRSKRAADGPRYKAIGNSMAVPVLRWLGQRIQMVENFTLSPTHPQPTEGAVR